MNKKQNILELIDFEGYINNINDKQLSNEKFVFIKNEIKYKINIDNIYFSGNYAAVYFKTIKSFDKNTLTEIIKTHKSIWNQRKVPFLYVSTPTELRIYNCFDEPLKPKHTDKLEQLEFIRYSTNDTKEHLQNLISIFSRISIDSGKIWEHTKIKEKINVTKRVDNVLIKNLKDTKFALEKKELSSYIIHELLTRSLFILYLEDIKATDREYYGRFKNGAKSYFDILKDSESTYKLFEHFETKFNGNLFAVKEEEKTIITNAELKLISSCFWGNEVVSGQQAIWRKFDFSVIPIELISQIYEIFLNKTKKEKNGEYYTPHSLVDLILNESLSWASKDNQVFDLKILDIACGSGIFLVESYRRLVDRWIFANRKQPSFDDLKNILLNSIYGFEINPESIKVASFSLYLALISYLDPAKIWQNEDTNFPYLIFNPKNKDKKKQGKNLFLQSSLSNTIEHQPTFDLIVGNPPFKSAKTGKLEPEISDYCKKYGFAQEMVLPFLHRAKEFCNENGSVSIISTSKILFNKNSAYQKFREFLFKDTYTETVINFSALRRPKKGQGSSVFSDAVGPSCVLFYKKKAPRKQKPNITYVCPKPTAKNQFSDSLVLDTLDFYYLPREECQKPDTIIWKTAMWGTENDFSFISNIWNKTTLKSAIDTKKGWKKGVGLIFMSPNAKRPYTDDTLKLFKLIQAKVVSRYHSPKKLENYSQCLTNENLKFYLKHNNTNSIDDIKEINIFRSKGNKETFTAPHLLVKEGQKDKRFTASYLEFDCSFKHTVYGISFNKKNISKKEFNSKRDLLKALTAFLNSKFASYALFLTSISWGVERERVTAKDMLQLPALPFEMPEEKVKELAQKVDKISVELSKDFKDENIIDGIENEIDKIIYSALNLSQREQYLIEDVLNYSLDLFQEGENSIAYKPVNKYNDELKDYLKIICEDINEHLEFSDTTVWASIQETPVTIPMKLVSVHITNEHKAGHIETYKYSKNINKLIKTIDKYSYEKHSASVYFRKVVRYYEGDIIYIMKPNEKRFWSRSQAMQDSSSILLEIANM